MPCGLSGKAKYFPKTQNYSETILFFSSKIFKSFQELTIDFATPFGTHGGLRIFSSNIWKSKNYSVTNFLEFWKMFIPVVRHLELIRMITLEDLRVAKTLCVPVFPPSYNILETFVGLYHEALSQRLNEIISFGLQDQEYVTVLTWIIQTYPGEELMRSWNLQIDPSLIKPLLDEETIEKLQKDYLDKLEGNYKEWMKNAFL